MGGLVGELRFRFDEEMLNRVVSWSIGSEVAFWAGSRRRQLQHNETTPDDDGYSATDLDADTVRGTGSSSMARVG